MQRGILGTKAVIQIGFVVHDVEKAAKAFAEFFGVEAPSWSLSDPYEKTGCEYKGKPCFARSKNAFFQIGDQLDLELIEPGPEPSVWRDWLDERGEGVHHIAFFIHGMGERVLALEGAGIPLLQKAEFTGGRYAYMDATAGLKVILELLEIEGRG
ncbi:MAG: VOC family protein [Christensenellaceae bacterium]|jgi:hypothetical protein|nr:VOC family protein [Christensenellaceae bacterium]